MKLIVSSAPPVSAGPAVDVLVAEVDVPLDALVLAVVPNVVVDSPPPVSAPVSPAPSLPASLLPPQPATTAAATIQPWWIFMTCPRAHPNKTQTAGLGPVGQFLVSRRAIGDSDVQEIACWTDFQVSA